MRCLALIGAALVLAGAAKPRQSVTWAVSWSEAIEEAKACNVPLVVHRHGFF